MLPKYQARSPFVLKHTTSDSLKLDWCNLSTIPVDYSKPPEVN